MCKGAMATDKDAVESAADFFSPTESTEESYMELRNEFLAKLSGDDRTDFSAIRRTAP